MLKKKELEKLQPTAIICSWKSEQSAVKGGEQQVTIQFFGQGTWGIVDKGAPLGITCHSYFF